MLRGDFWPGPAAEIARPDGSSRLQQAQQDPATVKKHETSTHKHTASPRPALRAAPSLRRRTRCAGAAAAGARRRGGGVGGGGGGGRGRRRSPPSSRSRGPGAGGAAERRRRRAGPCRRRACACPPPGQHRRRRTAPAAWSRPPPLPPPGPPRPPPWSWPWRRSWRCWPPPGNRRSRRPPLPPATPSCFRWSGRRRRTWCWRRGWARRCWSATRTWAASTRGCTRSSPTSWRWGPAALLPPSLPPGPQRSARAPASGPRSPGAPRCVPAKSGPFPAKCRGRQAGRHGPCRAAHGTPCGRDREERGLRKPSQAWGRQICCSPRSPPASCRIGPGTGFSTSLREAPGGAVLPQDPGTTWSRRCALCSAHVLTEMPRKLNLYSRYWATEHM